jgi:ClpA/ClpB-like protein
MTPPPDKGERAVPTNRSEDLARRVSQFDDPEAALRAVAALRARLTTLEEEHVRNALRAGASWGRIGRSLGITRQAAHKRFAARCRPDPELASAQTASTTQARRAVRFAAEEAASMGHASAGPEHLLLALLRDDQGLAVLALEQLDVHYSSARREVRALYGETEANGSPEPASRKALISARAREALERAVRLAAANGDKEVGVEHILVAVMRDPGGGAVRALAALGVSPRRVEATLRRVAGGRPPKASALR